MPRNDVFVDFCRREWWDVTEPWEGNPTEATRNGVSVDFRRRKWRDRAELWEGNPAGAP